MSQDIHIAVDAMGGDFGPRLCVSAALKFIKSHPNVRLTLVGDEPTLEALCTEFGATKMPSILHASQEVEMGDVPSIALRRKRESSMWKAIELVSSNSADACVSAGNTGALMAMSLALIGSIQGIKRPAICKPMPSSRGSSFLLDLGANLDCSSEQLTQFAIMGAALARLNGIACPRVAILNVGSEQTKGVELVQEAAKSISVQPSLEFIGFIEGNSLYKGTADVVVCDGFVGNVALKVSEGVATFIRGSLKDHFDGSLHGRLVKFLAAPVLKKWSESHDPSLYNGAAFLGLKNTVVKSHGATDALGFYKAIETAMDQVVAKIPRKIESSLEGFETLAV